jgi:hypothetical protein
MASQSPDNVQKTLVNDNFLGYRITKAKYKRQRIPIFVSVNKQGNQAGVSHHWITIVIPVSISSAN